ncbi:MAG TPA: sulfite exporter TauE/SafE family protein [Candidatus Limnocylindria bacterium]|nr:sulfite exporter TauE/SafE family protein [Candidatus Limnocylindria bacterium]
MPDTQAPSSSPASRFDALAERIGVSPRTLIAGIVLPIISLIVIATTFFVAPTDQRVLIILSSLVAIAAGLSSTAIGVYGGVLVPGLLLLGVDARFAAACSLFLQVLVIPLAAGSHYRMGNFNKKVALPLVIGGVIGAFIGPFFAAALPKEWIVRFVSAMIVFVGLIVLATLRFTGLGKVRDESDVPNAQVGGIGLLAGFSSGVSGAGWGPIGVKLLILSRIDPRQAIGSSLFARIFMAASAVLGFFIAQTVINNATANWWIVVPLFAGSVAPMIAGAMLLSRLGRERATIAITLLSIALALPSLIFGH